MKKYISAIILSSIACSAFADDYYWNFSAGWWGNWSDNFTNNEGKSANPAPSDNIYFNANKYFNTDFVNYEGVVSKATNNPYLVVESKNVGSLTFEDLFYTNTDGVEVGKSIEIRTSKLGENGTFTSQNLNIAGDLTVKFSKYESHAIFKGHNDASRREFNINVGGNIVVGGQTGANSNATLMIGQGNSATEYVDSLTVEGDVNFNGGQLVMNVGKDGASSIDNPDVNIKGIFYYNTSGSWAVSQRGAGMTGDTYIQLGGLQSVQGGSKISNGASASSSGTTFMVFNNAAGVQCNYRGWLREYNSGSRQLTLIMAGDGEQTFYETSKSTETQFNEFMRGDIIVYNGTMQVGSVDGVYKKLNLEGGKFSAFGDNTNVGIFKVKDIDWTAGTLLVNINLSGEADLIQIANNLNGLGGAGAKYMVEFDSAVEMENTEFKIVEFGGSNNIALADFVSNLDDQYDVNFEIRNNNEIWAIIGGAIPEPSTYALIIGALALGFVAYRRKN